jgi:large subunit ribosomal protein L6e
MVKSKTELLAKRKESRKKNLEENKNLKKRKNWYPTSDMKGHFKRKCKIPHKAHVPKALNKGQVLILLTGRFRGRRVVYLKKLEKSGLLLVTGPYKINGVPLKRVNQAYVLPTSTKVEIGNVNELDSINDEFFKRVTLEEKAGEKKVFFEEEKVKRDRITDERKKMQTAVDTVVKTAVDKVPMLKEYLRNRFALKSGDKPHLMKF